LFSLDLVERMRQETPAAMRVRILSEFSQLKLPAMLPAQAEATPAELAMVREIFREGFVEGAILPDHTGSGIAGIHITGISSAAHDLVAAARPHARAKRGALRTWKVVLAILGAIALILSILVSWQKLHEPHSSPTAAPTVSPSPSASTSLQP
jgi:hypothetical protein